MADTSLSAAGMDPDDHLLAELFAHKVLLRILLGVLIGRAPDHEFAARELLRSADLDVRHFNFVDGGDTQRAEAIRDAMSALIEQSIFAAQGNTRGGHWPRVGHA